MGNSPSTPFESCLASALPRSAISVPSDPLYHLTAVKPYNLAYDITPIAVVRPSTTEEVSKVVICANDNGIKVQARSGGHSYGDYGIGGESGALAIDMVNFQQFSLDEVTGHAIIGSGTLLKDITKRLHDAGGRAMAHGTSPQIGIGGHATIGGLGPVSRQWGTALDHIIEAEVVLANGTIVWTTESNNPEVLWAIKGAAASFGVVTQFKFITHPEPQEILQYSYMIKLGTHKSMADTFIAWQEFISQPDLDRKLASYVIVLEGAMIVKGVYFGSQSEFEALGFDEKLGHNATLTLDHWLGAVADWAENEAVSLLGGVSSPFYAKDLAFRNDTLIPNDTIHALFELFDSPNKGSSLWFAYFDLEAGAINDIPQDASAYAQRDALFYIQTYIIGVPTLKDNSKQFLNDINSLLENALPNSNLGSYAGYVDPFLQDGQQRYWRSNYPRLQELKSALDPKDIFHNPQSVVGA